MIKESSVDRQSCLDYGIKIKVNIKDYFSILLTNFLVLTTHLDKVILCIFNDRDRGFG